MARGAGAMKAPLFAKLDDCKWQADRQQSAVLRCESSRGARRPDERDTRAQRRGRSGALAGEVALHSSARRSSSQRFSTC